MPYWDLRTPLCCLGLHLQGKTKFVARLVELGAIQVGGEGHFDAWKRLKECFPFSRSYQLTISKLLFVRKTNLWCVVDLEKFPIIQQLSLLVLLLYKNLLLRTLTLALIQASEARAYLAPIAKLKKTTYKNTKPKSIDFEQERKF